MDAVRAAFDATPREGYLPRRSRRRAGHDGPIPIGHGQTNSQPRTVADMLRLLEVGTGNRVLDVGSGSGWTTALLAHLTGPTGSVIGVEIEPDLVTFGSANLTRANRPWARIERARPHILGWPQEAPYDRILVSANALSVPEELLGQLAPEGRMVIPVSSAMLLVRATESGPVVSEHGAYRFVPLR